MLGRSKVLLTAICGEFCREKYGDECDDAGCDEESGGQ